MKKIITLACALSCIIGASAQSINDAAKLAEKDLNGTARFVGMGGAMGALGGDITTIATIVTRGDWSMPMPLWRIRKGQ